MEICRCGAERLRRYIVFRRRYEKEISPQVLSASPNARNHSSARPPTHHCHLHNMMGFKWRRREVPWEVVDHKVVDSVPMFYDDEGQSASHPILSSPSLTLSTICGRSDRSRHNIFKRKRDARDLRVRLPEPRRMARRASFREAAVAAGGHEAGLQRVAPGRVRLATAPATA